MTKPSMPFETILNNLQEVGGGDLFRGILQSVCQSIINLEADEHVGAAPYERTEGRAVQRNGSRSRGLETRVGELELRIPKMRQGSFFPSILEPRRRTEQALFSVIQEAWVNGISTRAVDNLVQAMGLDGIDKSKVSRICEDLSSAVYVFQDRPIESKFLYVWVDATYIRVRDSGRIQSKALMIAIGLNELGEREVIGFTLGQTESYEAWVSFMRSLVARGMSAPLLLISDAHEGIKKAASEVFYGTSWQRCRVHFMRNILSMVSKTQQPMVSAALKQIYLQTDQKSALDMVKQVAQKLERQLPKVANKIREEALETLSYMAFPAEHWKQIHSTNGLERLNREMKRRADVVGIFPNDDSVIRLLGSILAEQHDEWLVCRKVYSQESIRKALGYVPEDPDPIATKAPGLSLGPIQPDTVSETI